MMQSTPLAIHHEFVTKVDEATDSKYGCNPEERSMSMHIKYGLLNIDKPAGPSSHEIVAWIKRMMKLSHAGHGGTLETL